MNNTQLITNLSDKELDTLQALADLGEASVIEIARKTGIKRTTVYNFVGKLVASGYVEPSLRNGYRRYSISPSCPKLLVSEKPVVENKFDSFQLLTTKYAMRQALRKTLEAGDKKVDWLVGAPSTTDYLGNRYIEKYIDEALAKGVEVRTLRSPMTVPEHKYGSDEAVKNLGRNLRRTQSDLPFKTTFTIHDDTLTFISSERGGVGYIIRDQEMADSFRFIYNGLWKYAKVIGEEKYE